MQSLIRVISVHSKKESLILSYQLREDWSDLNGVKADMGRQLEYTPLFFCHFLTQIYTVLKISVLFFHISQC